MINTVLRHASKAAGTGLVATLALAVAGCGGMPTNRTLESVHQPVVDRVNYTLDVATGPGGLSYPEQRRVSGWFDAMDLRYGDRISVDDPLDSEATRQAIETIAARRGLLINSEAPVTPGYVNAGTARIVITRARATVPGCPDWSAKSDVNLNNATSSNYGCATNSNLAAMVANPEHLIKGAVSDSDTVVMSSSKAIGAYRAKASTSGEVRATGSKGE